MAQRSLFLLIPLIAFGVGCRPSPKHDLAALGGFRHTKRVDADGTEAYRIFGDAKAVRAAIPNAADAPVEVTPQGTVSNFTLPSGRRATLVWSAHKSKPSHLVVDP